jgi:hypothetical protein
LPGEGVSLLGGTSALISISSGESFFLDTLFFTGFLNAGFLFEALAALFSLPAFFIKK